MSKITDIQAEWRGFAAKRGLAMKALNELKERNNAEIERLRTEMNEAEAEFQETWRQNKANLAIERDEIVAEALLSGRSALSILNEMGSQNTVWIYKLRNELITAGKLIEANVDNSFTADADKLRLERDPSEYDQVKWLSGPGAQLTGWYISEDLQLVKRERRERWFIAGPENEFLKGDRGFYTLTGDKTISERADMLMDAIEAAQTA